MNARFLLEALDVVCPLTGMGAHHSVTLHEGSIVAGVWAYGKHYTFGLGDAEEAKTLTREGAREVATQILGLIAKPA